MANTPTFSLTTLFQRLPSESLVWFFSFSNGLKLHVPWTLGRVETGRQVQKHFTASELMLLNLLSAFNFLMLRLAVSFTKTIFV